MNEPINVCLKVYMSVPMEGGRDTENINSQHHTIDQKIGQQDLTLNNSFCYLYYIDTLEANPDSYIYFNSGEKYFQIIISFFHYTHS
jgi:hypothetical protein